MANGNLKNRSVRGLDQDGEEAVESVERAQGIENVAPEHPECAAGVLERGPEGPLSGEESNAGGEPADGGILSVHTPAANHGGGPGVEGFEESGEFGGIILAITIQGGDEGMVGLLQTGPDCGALTGVAGMAQSANPRVACACLEDLLPGGIGAGVVDVDQLPIEVGGIEGGGHFEGEGEDVARFVEDGNDNRH